MSPQEFISHPIFQKLSDLRSLLDSENARSKIDIDRKAFFEAFYDFLSVRLKSVNPILLRQDDLRSTWSELEAGTQQINEFLSKGNDGHLENAINHFHTAIFVAKILHTAVEFPNYDFSKVISDFQKAVKEGYDQLKSINSKLKIDLEKYNEELVIKQTQLRDLERKISENDLELQNQLSKYRTDFENIQNTAISNIDIDRKKFFESIEDDRKKFVNQNEEQKKEFKDEFKTVISAHDEQFLVKKLAFENDTKNLIEEIRKELESGIKNLDIKLTEAKKIVNVIGNVGVTGNYQNIANQNKENANTWRNIAIGFMVLMSGLIIWSIIDLSKAGFDIYKSLVRILAAAVLTYPAIYASRESSKHRALETYNRNLELELASIGPFIEMLNEDKKQKIKEELVTKYFGNQKDQMNVKEGDDEVSLNALDKIVKIITPFLKK